MRTVLMALGLVCLASVATSCSRETMATAEGEESAAPPEAADVVPPGGESAAQAIGPSGAVGEVDGPSEEGLPAPDEIPAFLGGAQMPPDPPLVVELDDRHLDEWSEEWSGSEREPTLQELMARVTVGDHEPEEADFSDFGLSPEPPEEAFVGDGSYAAAKPPVEALVGDGRYGAAAPPEGALAGGGSYAAAALPSRRAAGASDGRSPPAAESKAGTNREEPWAKSSDPSLQALMESVTLENDSATESWSYLGGGVSAHRADPQSGPGGIRRSAAPLENPDSLSPDEEGRIDRDESSLDESDPAPAPERLDPADPAPPDASPCEPLRLALAQHRDYLLRVGAERDGFGYVESHADSSALRLLQGLRRCSSNPEDADCKRPPIEVDISDLEVPSHQIVRDPSDLNAEGRSPDDIPHDRVSLDLLHKLKQCERSQIAQPLLQR